MYGFAIWIDRGRKGPLSDFAVERTDCGTTLSSKCFGMYTRPLASTPEARMELQPLVDQRTILTYTGRIDNRRQVAELLHQPGLALAADGAVMLAAYAAWGEAFPAKLNGEYSFAVVDRHDGRLVAGRDALGIHKLYVLEETRRLWIASNLALLLASVPKEPGISSTGAADFIAGGATLGPLLRTLFRSVNYVGAGPYARGRGIFQTGSTAPILDTQDRPRNKTGQGAGITKRCSGRWYLTVWRWRFVHPAPCVLNFRVG